MLGLAMPRSRRLSSGRFWLACLVLLAAGSASAPAQTGWYVQPTPATKNLYDIDFLTSRLAWISGEEGTIIQTTDGGASWNAQNSGTSYGLRGISFGSPLVGIAVGTGGTIIRTTNGGVSWMTVQDGYVDTFFKVEMLNDHFGCAVGYTGFHAAWVATTTDGGANWNFTDFLVNGTGCSAHDVHFFDSLHGLISIWVEGGPGAIYKTSDGGNNWTQVLLTQFGLYTFSWPTSTVGYVSGYEGHMLRTTDGGSTWTELNTGTGYLTRNYGVSFSDPRTGWIVTDGGRIRHTTDAGLTWADQWSGTTEPLNAIHMVDGMDGFIGADTGLLLRTTTGGASGAGVQDLGSATGEGLRLLPSQPNPFSASTRVRFSLPASGPVRLEIYDVAGRLVRAAGVQGVLGPQSWTWDGRDDAGRQVAAGAYQCRVRDAYGNTARQMLLRTR